MNTTYTFKVHSLRTLSSPYQKTGEKDAECIYYLLIDMRELPEGLPLDVNPREPKMTTNVARRIINAVVEPETDFYINNRGIVIAAQKVIVPIQRLRLISAIRRTTTTNIHTAFLTAVIHTQQSWKTVKKYLMT